MKKQFYILILISPFFLIAQTQKKDTTLLDEVLLKTTISKFSSFKKTSIGIDEIKSNDGVILTPILNKIAGVNMQQGALNTNRITIRGIGSRAQFSTTRVKTYINNVPLTNANGESVLDDLDLNTLGQIQIIKGPKSSIYGANLGGNILLSSHTDPTESLTINSTIGSFNRFLLGVSANQNLGKTNVQTSFNQFQSQGYRDNSAYDRQNLSLRTQTDIGEKYKLENLALFTKLKAFIPSSLNEDDFENNPTLAASNWYNSAGFESYEKVFLASTLYYAISENTDLVTSIFFNHRDAFEPRPFDILDENETGFGLRSQLNYRFKWKQDFIKTKLGLEFQRDDYQASNFNNLYRNTPERESVQGEMINAFRQKRNRFNVFAEAQLALSSKFDLELGLNLNVANYKTTDNFILDGLDQSDNLSFTPKLLPNLSLHHKLNEKINLFANYSKGIATPSIAESLDEQGSFNPNLKPTYGSNIEIGTFYSSLNGNFNLEFSAFNMSIDDLIVTRRIDEDIIVGVNAGASNNLGFELTSAYFYDLASGLKLKLDTNFSFYDFKFTDFVDDENDFSDNKIPAVPEYDWHLGAAFFYNDVLSLRIETEFVGEMPVNDANTQFTDNYNLLNLNFGYKRKISLTDLVFNFGINNVLDKNFAASIVPNATGFGGNSPRFFYPSLARHFYFKVLINFKL